MREARTHSGGSRALCRVFAQAVILSGVYAYWGRWKLPPLEGGLRLMLVYHIRLHLNYDFYENHVFGAKLLGRDCSFLLFCLKMGNSLPAVRQGSLLTSLQKHTDASALYLPQIA